MIMPTLTSDRARPIGEAIDRSRALEARLADLLPTLKARQARAADLVSMSAERRNRHYALDPQPVELGHDARAELDAARAKIANLEIALTTARRIGAAVGIVMAELKLTDARAFEALVKASQARHVKVRDFADEVLLTGTIHAPSH
jgi:hypothetical protein